MDKTRQGAVVRVTLVRILGVITIMSAAFGFPTAAMEEQADSIEIANLLRQFDRDSLKDNPLIPYETASKIRKMLCPEAEDRTGFWQSYANFSAFFGDIKGTMQAFARVCSKRPAENGPLLNSVLDDYRPLEAVKYVTERAANRQFVMLGEEHMDPQSRCLLLPMLKALRPLGYKYFAAETFIAPLDSTNQAGQALNETGVYVRDPIFAEAVNEAIRLGYILVAYESDNEPEEIKKAGEPKRSNFREMSQARNLQERILKKDPAAKVIVWAGRGHVYTELIEPKTTKNEDEVWQPMGYLFRKLTGQQPLSLVLCHQLEMAIPDRESSEYKYAANKGWLKHPTVFVRDGKPYDDCGAAQVFFPRQNFSNGRADWLQTELGRVECQIPQQILFRDGRQLVQAFVDQASKDAVAIDCVLIDENEPPPPLMLPRHSKFKIRAIDKQGRSNGEAFVETK